MSSLLLLLPCEIPDLTSNNTDEYFVVVPLPGKFRMIAASFAPRTASTANATDYGTIAIKKGLSGNTIGSMDTSTTGMTKGTRRDFTLSGGKDLEFDSGTATDTIQVAVTKSTATGVTIGGSVCMVLEKLPGD